MLQIGDKIQVRAQGVGLKIKGFEDVRINKLSPFALENDEVKIESEEDDTKKETETKKENENTDIVVDVASVLTT